MTIFNDMEWAEFFHICGEMEIEFGTAFITIEELYSQFENRFISTHHVNSEELLYSADIVKSD